MYKRQAHETEFRVKNRRIPAGREFVRDTRHRVVLDDIWTVEHLLGVLFFLQIDCCEIWVEKGREIPGLDGGGWEIYRRIKEAGIEELDKEKEMAKLSGIYREDDRIFLVYPSSGFSAFYLVDYPHPLFPAWYLADMENPEPVMRARTYTFLSWVEESVSYTHLTLPTKRIV